MPTLDALSFGPSGAMRFARNSGRSITGEALGAIRYPSPFFDIAHTYLPTSFKTMLRWCRYYFLTNPLINAVCYKMSEYPVTDLVFDGDSDHLNDRWSKFFSDILHFKKFEVESGLDYNTYGNAFVSLYFPFQKMLKCKQCSRMVKVDQQKYIFREYAFVGECPYCRYYGEFSVKDHYLRSARDIRLIRWNPEYITIQHNEATGDNRYYYVIPPSLANDVRMAKRHIIEQIPQVFIEALRKNKALLFSRQNIYHMQRPTIAQKDRGWGMPMILPVLKDTFYLQVLRKAQEAIAIEHIVPLRILFPQSASSSADVYCVSLDTLVETREGIRPAGEVHAGDWVKTHTGLWKRVEDVRDRPVDKSSVHKITAASLSAFPFTVTGEHPLYAARKLGPRYENVGEPEWINAGDLQKGDYVLYPRKRITWGSLELDLAEYIPERAVTENFIYRRLNQSAANIYEYLEVNGLQAFERGGRENFIKQQGWDLDDYKNARAAFTQQDTIDRIPRYLKVDEDLAYVIGLYIAEGTPKGDCAAIALHVKEAHLMDRLDAAIKRLGFRDSTRGFNGNSARYEINDIFLGQFLTTVCGRGAHSKRLPRFLLEAPDNIALAALQGVYDGDGCNIATETRRVNLMTVSPELAVEVRQLLLSFGFIAGVQQRIPREDEISKLPIYHVNVNGKQAEDLAVLLGWDPAKVERRIDTHSQCGFFRGDYVYLRVNSIETVTNVETVRGLQIEGDKSFCVVGVATHNSTVNLTQWRDKIENELIRWRLDNNYIPILPVPIGSETLGGDGKALMLAQEYRQWAEHIIAGMGVPIEFVFGGMQYCKKIDSYLFSSKGLVQLKDLIPTAHGTTAGSSEVSVATRIGTQRIEAAHNTGTKKNSLIRTKLGLDSESSYDHRFLVLSKDISMVWKKTSEIIAGDFIAVRAGMNLWPSETPSVPQKAFEQIEEWRQSQKLVRTAERFPVPQLSKELTLGIARLLGYLISEGTCGETSLAFTQKCQEVMDDFLNTVENVFGYRPTKWDSGFGCTTTEIGRRPAVLLLQAMGAIGDSYNKVVPWCVRQAPKHLVAEFLRAYFEGDGSVSTSNTGKQMVSCGSKSEELLKQIQLLLLNMGIVSSRYFNPTSEMWQLQIRSEYIDVFAKEIGFVSTIKQEYLKNRTPVGKTHVGERIPYLKEALDQVRQKYFTGKQSWSFEPINVQLDKEEYTVQEVADILERDFTTVHYHIKQGRLKVGRTLPGVSGRFGTDLILREDLQAFLQHYGRGVHKVIPGRSADGMTYSRLSDTDLSFLREKEPELAKRIELLAEAHYIWDEVQEVELFDFEVPMGDLTIDTDHSYVADGLVTHNSGSNVSMRILENHFLDVKTQRKQLVTDFIMPNVSAFMGWDSVPCHYKRFKMADDLQRSAFYMQLNQAGKISDKSLLEDTDWDSRKEAEGIERERKMVLEGQRNQALSQASIQGEAQLIMAKYQMRGQKLMTEMTPEAAGQGMPAAEPMPGMGQPGLASPAAEGQMMNTQSEMMNRSGQIPGMEIPPIQPMEEGPVEQAGVNQGAGGSPPAMGEVQSQLPENPSFGLDLQSVASQVVKWLNKLPDHEKNHELVKMQVNNPQLYSLVLVLLQQATGAERSSAATPAPPQRVPRRGPEAQSS